MKQTKNKKSKSHSPVSAIIVTLVLLTGISLLLYPTVADYINSLNYKKDIEDYRREVQQLDVNVRQEMLAAAHKYNTALLERSARIGGLDPTMKKEYDSLLDPLGTGMMGYIVIEKVGLYLPIYHGTGENVLQTGIGHIESSSLPVGGVGTNAILSGHTGLPSSKLFSSIDQLKKGDIFYLHILGEVLTYQVESAVVLLPKEAEKQEIDPQSDLCTLMTCTPYGVNSHRLLVTGVRIRTPKERLSDENKPFETISASLPPVLWAVIIGLPVLTAVVIAVVVRKVRLNKKTQ